jgi:epoxide hydrolase-like predicted phosphatase
MIKVIISDLGGVFLNRGIWKFWDYLEGEFEIQFEQGKNSFLKYYKSYFSGEISEEEFWDKFLTDIELEENWMGLRSILLNFFEPNEGMIELYKRLRSTGVKLILLSDQTKEWWVFLNNKFEIESHFDSTIVSALVGVNKPDPKIYQLAFEASNSKPEECLFIDDLEHNLIPARDMGIQTILFENSEQLKNELYKKYQIL